MGNSRWDQIGAACGIVFVALQMAAQGLIRSTVMYRIVAIRDHRAVMMTAVSATSESR